MKRYEFNVSELNNNNNGFIADFLKEQLSKEKMPFYIDSKLLFWEHHFDYHDFTVYDNGHKKGGTIRYIENTIRIPSYNILAVYESNEYKEKKLPRALTKIDKVIISPANKLSLEELQMDGFESQKELIEGMKDYYPTITPSSIISFYVFGKSIFDPNVEGLKKFFEKRNIDFPQ